MQSVSQAIPNVLSSAKVTTAQDLADEVGGTLASAQNLTGKLGTALEIVGLMAALLIASFLTLSSVAKRVRELGTLKAIGWPQRKVVRQVAMESTLQGALGGALGAMLGIAAAAAVSAIGITLKATLSTASSTSTVPGPFGQGSASSVASTLVSLGAPVHSSIVLIAIALAIAGGLVAGAIGGLRAARLRPAEALRSVG